MNGRYIAYYRVSTQMQGRSGLGLDAQQKAVAEYLNGGDWELIEEFTEVESGKSRARPQLQRAIEACHLYGAALVVAKVDRLTRSVAFLHAILDAGVEVHFCDLPQLSGPTGRFMLNQMAAVAELEAGLISERTKAALARAKARGTKLGNPQNLSNRAIGSQNGNMARSQQADQRAKRVLVEIEEIRKGGPRSLRQLAEGLNLRGIPTPSRRGKKWNAVQVKRVLERSERVL